TSRATTWRSNHLSYGHRVKRQHGTEHVRCPPTLAPRGKGGGRACPHPRSPARRPSPVGCSSAGPVAATPRALLPRPHVAGTGGRRSSPSTRDPPSPPTHPAGSAGTAPPPPAR